MAASSFSEAGGPDCYFHMYVHVCARHYSHNKMTTTEHSKPCCRLVRAALQDTARHGSACAENVMEAHATTGMEHRSPSLTQPATRHVKGAPTAAGQWRQARARRPSAHAPANT